MKRAAVAFLVASVVGVVGLAALPWHEVQHCPPTEAYAYCSVAVEGVWTAARLDPGWHRLALASETAIDIVDPFSGERIASLAAPTSSTRFTGLPAFDMLGLRIACAMSDKAIHVWTVDSGEEILAVPAWSDSCNAAFASDGTAIAAQGETGQVTVWDVETGKPQYACSPLIPYDTWHVSGFDASGSFLYAMGVTEEGGPFITGVWSALSASLVAALPGVALPLPDGSVVLVTPLSASRTQIIVYEALGGKLMRAFYALGAVSAIAAGGTAGDQVLALALADGTVGLWSLSEGREVYRLDVAGTVASEEDAEDLVILSVSFSPGGSLLATGSTIAGASRSYFHIWNVTAPLAADS